MEQELERLQRDGVIEPVRFSEWAAPVVPVSRKIGDPIKLRTPRPQFPGKLGTPAFS